MESQPKVRIRITFRDDEMRLIEVAAKKERISVPMFIIKAAVKAAK